MKNMFRKMGLPVLLLGALSIIIYACSKNNSAEPEAIPEGQQRVNLMLTDDPGLFDQVLIDIQKVEVLVDTCAGRGDDDDDDDRWDDRDRCGWWEDRRHDDDDEECEMW